MPMSSLPSPFQSPTTGLIVASAEFCPQIGGIPAAVAVEVDEPLTVDNRIRVPRLPSPRKSPATGIAFLNPHHWRCTSCPSASSTIHSASTVVQVGPLRRFQPGFPLNSWPPLSVACAARDSRRRQCSNATCNPASRRRQDRGIGSGGRKRWNEQDSELRRHCQWPETTDWRRNYRDWRGRNDRRGLRLSLR